MDNLTRLTWHDLVILVQRDKHTGKIKDIRVSHNLVVDAGLAWMAQYVGSSTPPANISHMAIGTGTTPPDSGDTALEAQVGARVAVTKTYEASPSPRIKCMATFDNHTGAITEEGLFNAATSGTMIARNTFAAMNLGSGDSLTVTHYLVPQASA